MFRDADLGVRPCDIDAHALHAMILERCRRPLGHEMKNAVQSMYAGIEVLAKSLAAGPAARVSPEQCVMLLRQQLDGLQTTLGRILDDVAPERTATQTFDAAAVLRDLARFLSTDAAVAGVKLRLALPSQALVTARPHVARSVLLGFFLSSIDALRGGGELAIAVREEAGRTRVEFALQRDAGAWPAAQDASSLDARYLRTTADSLLALEQGECTCEMLTESTARLSVTLPSG
ncbi:MAG: hypothetical protein DIU71_13705 [Proteobacteria bacterium]|nr:MAG: hypothetical protein DIU71_13705 [Pseudomonadota bacterium]